MNLIRSRVNSLIVFQALGGAAVVLNIVIFGVFRLQEPFHICKNLLFYFTHTAGNVNYQSS